MNSFGRVGKRTSEYLHSYSRVRPDQPSHITTEQHGILIVRSIDRQGNISSLSRENLVFTITEIRSGRSSAHAHGYHLLESRN